MKLRSSATARKAVRSPSSLRFMDELRIGLRLVWCLGPTALFVRRLKPSSVGANSLGVGLKLIMQRHHDSRCSANFCAVLITGEQHHTQVICPLPAQSSPSPLPPRGRGCKRGARAVHLVPSPPWGRGLGRGASLNLYCGWPLNRAVPTHSPLRNNVSREYLKIAFSD